MFYQQKTPYQFASIDYLLFIRNFMSQKIREQFQKRVDEDTREFLRFVKEPNVSAYSQVYQKARDRIMEDYRTNLNDTTIWDNIFAETKLAHIFRYYAEIFKYISSELYEDFSDELAKYDFLHSKINGGIYNVYNPIAPTENEYVEMRLKNAIIYDVINSNEDIRADIMSYYDYLGRRRIPLVDISNNQISKAYNLNDLETYVLCLIREWNTGTESPRHNKQKKEKMAIL
jgi:formiminotetrahydrofolate cyclodeaminase